MQGPTPRTLRARDRRFSRGAQGLRERLRADPQLMSLLAGDDQNAWLRDRVGTVHTFQGKEAEAVMLILGAPLASHSGARGWAGGRPNILNVAVTRAQCVLYVIGNRQLWRRHGVFGVLDKHLPDGRICQSRKQLRRSFVSRAEAFPV